MSERDPLYGFTPLITVNIQYTHREAYLPGYTRRGVHIERYLPGYTRRGVHIGRYTTRVAS